MPEGVPPIPHEDVLRYEEFLRICGAAVKNGIHTIRVTGGEPLVRKGCIGFLRELKATPGIESVTLTTNGILLEPYVDELAEIGIGGVNISLDSLDASVYKRITGHDGLDAVLQSLHKTVGAGLRVKLNCVLIKGLNDGDMAGFMQLAERLPVDIRFISYMPTSAGKCHESVTGSEILARLLEAYPDLTPDNTRRGFGPAKYYKSGKMPGSVGIIDSAGNCFCPGCNRVRLTSTGFLKLCLYRGDGLDLRGLLRAERRTGR